MKTAARPKARPASTRPAARTATLSPAAKSTLPATESTQLAQIPEEDPDPARKSRSHQAAHRRTGEEEGAREQSHLAEADVEVPRQRTDDRAHVAAVPAGDRRGEDEDADAASRVHWLACTGAGG